MPASSDSAPELMELTQAEALGIFDNYERGVRAVDSHLYHRGGDKYVDISLPEAFYCFPFLFRGKSSVQKSDFKLGKSFFKLFASLLGGDEPALFLALFYHGTDNIDLPALCDLFFHKPVYSLSVALTHDKCVYLLAALGHIPHERYLQIAVECERQRSGYGSCRHGENMRALALFGELGAL